MGTTMVLPSAIRYQTELAGNIAALKAAGVEGNATTLKSVTSIVNELTDALSGLEGVLAADAGHELTDEAKYALTTILPAMAAVRAAGDKLETVVADDLWSLPTYQEMLHIL